MLNILVLIFCAWATYWIYHNLGVKTLCEILFNVLIVMLLFHLFGDK